jgi:CheY-like chemotaxis protein
VASGIHAIRARATVMVVDDDADIRATLTDILEEEGYCVVDSPDGEAALRHLEQGELPTVMLLDLMMPRCSGWEVLVACAKSERLKRLPVVVMSALDPRAAQVAVSIAAHVCKPIDVGALVERIRDIADASQPIADVSHPRAV